jgi:uncharacterized protein YndB with AHSA1/START domain
MNDYSVKHGSFTLERIYDASASEVFAAWSDRDAKAEWFAPQDDRYSLDFRVGGTEAVHGGEGVDLVARSEYHDIVPGARIVYTTALSADEVLSTVSLTTVQFEPDGERTRLVLTEQDVFLDDREQQAWREQGTGDWLDALGRRVARSR